MSYIRRLALSTLLTLLILGGALLSLQLFQAVRAASGPASPPAAQQKPSPTNPSSANLGTPKPLIPSAPAAAIIVNSLADGAPANNGQCTLREALLNANGDNQSGSTDCVAGSGADTITFSVNGTINLTSVLPDISQGLTINGSGANLLTVRRNDGAADFRIFNIPGGGLNITLSGMTISNGRGTSGGGIFSASNLTLTNCDVSGNVSVGNIGGGVLLSNANGTFSGCTISGNTSQDRGGGISFETGSSISVLLTLTNCTVSGNTATGAGAGGGIFNLGFAGTSALQITNCTFANNAGAADTGGVRVGAIGAGTTATATLRNTIIANSTGANLVALTASGGVATITSQGFNLSDNGNGFLTQGTDITAPPLLGPLANNGGTTATHALLGGSPALDKGSSVAGVTTDQRGLTRPFNIGSIPAASGGNDSDIGAYEAFTSDVTAPGDPIVGIAATVGSPTSSASTVGTVAGANNYPAAEPPSAAIDNDFSAASKYLNFGKTGVGFIVTAPTQGPLTVVDGLRFNTANDAPERDPLTVTIEGTNSANPTTTLNSTWTTIYSGVTGLATDPGRNTLGAVVNFSNTNAFSSYRLIVASVRDGATANSMQFSEVELLGTPAPTISINDVTQAEGAAGTTNFTFTVTLSAAAGSPVTVNFATADGTATAGSDYTATSGTLTFNAGETSKTIAVSVVGETLFETNETFFVNLSNVTGGATLADNQGVGTITNDDTLPTLSINDVTLNEGNSGTTAFTFTITLAPASGATTTVNIATADGTATAPSDYTTPIIGTTFTFNPGETSKTATIQVNGDTTGEVNETFFVNLSSPVNATIADGQGLGTILNDDAFLVTTADDAGAGSLRQAITDANATGPGADVINFSALFNTAQTINLATVLPSLTTSMNINGPGANLLTVRRDTGGDYRIFTINAGQTVSLSNLTISNGKSPSGQPGGGILNAGTLNLANCIVSGNSSGMAFGGGISSGGSLSINNSLIASNNAGNGGGVAASGTLIMSNSTVSNNTATFQAALNFQNGTGSLTNCTVSGNTAGTYPGAILNATNTGQTSALTLTNCTVSGNVSTTSGIGNIVTSNNGVSATTQLKNTLVAANTGPNFTTSNATLTLLGNNLDSDGSSGFTNGVNGNIVGTAGAPINAWLGLLADNGGRTPTHALLLGSPALDKGSLAAGVTTDQRGLMRPFDIGSILPASNGNDSDIGAFEAQSLPLPGLIINDITVAEGNAGTSTATFTVTLSAASAQTVTVQYATANGTA
ncbi:MAG: CSLREA domain-containing protein, partial [Acidobacteria bacterium]|nr:CSLREA domain-containing protein [Acidobacteriota bacterium]